MVHGWKETACILAYENTYTTRLALVELLSSYCFYFCCYYFYYHDHGPTAAAFIRLRMGHGWKEITCILAHAHTYTTRLALVELFSSYCCYYCYYYCYFHDHGPTVAAFIRLRMGHGWKETACILAHVHTYTTWLALVEL